MKILILDLYRLIYRITGKNTLSIVITLVYITILNLIVAYGLGTLLPGSTTSEIIAILFRFPIYFATAIIMFLVNFWIMYPLKNIKKERNNKISYWGIIMYTCIALLLIAYAKYGNEIF